MRIAPDGPALTAVSTAAGARTSARILGTASTEPESGTGRPGAGRFAAVLPGVVGRGSFPLPGGRTDIGESLAGCGVRETREVAGIDVEVSGIVGTCTGPRQVFAHVDGEVRREFSVCLLGRPVGGELRVSEESQGVVWFIPAETDGLPVPVPASIRRRPADWRSGGIPATHTPAKVVPRPVSGRGRSASG